ncbi:MAG: hypothetical protein IJ438_05915 [Clostridia bacterium]|nr:hypothetical protein [Clostridia bacterium]
MKKWLDSPKAIFAALRVLSVAALLLGVGMAVWLNIPPLVSAMVAEPSVPTLALVLALMLVPALANVVLWSIAWVSFLRMCGRLMQGGTAFTAENSRSLGTIGKSVAGMAAATFLRVLPEIAATFGLNMAYVQYAGNDSLVRQALTGTAYSCLHLLVLPAVFLTVSMLAFILRRMLNNAMALEAEQADVV